MAIGDHMKAKCSKKVIVGIGNCASSLVQGVGWYSNHEGMCGTIHNNLIEPKVEDILFSSAFDIDKRKVGLPLSSAITQPPVKSMTC